MFKMCWDTFLMYFYFSKRHHNSSGRTVMVYCINFLTYVGWERFSSFCSLVVKQIVYVCVCERESIFALRIYLTVACKNIDWQIWPISPSYTCLFRNKSSCVWQIKAHGITAIISKINSIKKQHKVTIFPLLYIMLCFFWGCLLHNLRFV